MPWTERKLGYVCAANTAGSGRECPTIVVRVMDPTWRQGCLWLDEVAEKSWLVILGVCEIGFEMWEG